METTSKTLHDLGFGNKFLDLTPQVQAIKEKIGKLNFFNIKNYCSSMGFINNIKRQPTEWGKYF